MIRHGDCLEVMRGMDAASVDAIVTDPPYGLSFMGKDWDSFKEGDIAMRRNPEMDAVNCGMSRQGGRQRACAGYQKRQARDMRSYQDWAEGIFTEALRVAKPGCHLLAFGGTRTFHRLTCAIEDAGWEIRDCLMYVYGSGFPKSHNIGCKCGGNAVPYSHEGTKTVSEHDLRPMRESDLSEAVDAQDKQGQVLFEGVQEHGLSTQGREQLPAPEVRPRESGLEGRSDILPQARELQTDKVRSLSDGIKNDGPQGRICDGASPHNGKGNGKAAIEAGGRPSQESRSAGQPTRKHRTVRVESGAQDSRICPTCGGLLDRIGYGSALKPAFEPIILARKPLDGTLVQNSMKWGTGAVNVDGCRVGTTDAPRIGNIERSDSVGYGASTWQKSGTTPAQGRWPANLIHDGSDEVLELFPQTTSGEKRTTHKRHVSKMGNGGNYGDMEGEDYYRPFPGDSGSAARFFYCAKASRREREMGCDGMEEVDRPYMQTANGTSGKSSMPNKTVARGCNNHPTVKPLALMRYLCRLVTPPNGLVLDPFMGSGTTGIAAQQEGFRFIGIDNNAEYVEIATRRIASVERQAEASL